MEDNVKIISKIRDLLRLAEGSNNDDEGQTAFLAAQKLMLKYHIDKKEMLDISTPEHLKIDDDSVTIYKKLYWWEKQLAAIIAENFRVKSYIQSKQLHYGENMKSAIMFFGYEQDLELAKEMFILAYDAIKIYAKRHAEDLPVEVRNKIKRAYVTGFLDGMDNKFHEQFNNFTGEYALMVQTPKEVEEAFEKQINLQGESKSSRMDFTELLEYQQHYNNGYNSGNNIDFTKSTIDEEVF